MDNCNNVNSARVVSTEKKK
uniref:Uncharacterized protein n=1 Tax=Arundo donax TaxID=35708 RepID=A0A0A9HPZ7_ARUDO